MRSGGGAHRARHATAAATTTCWRGEAFDWLLLAERLLDEIPGLAPVAEVEALLFTGRWPLELDDDDFAARLGAAKYSAHLNYTYGVLVEQALQLSVEEEIHKENHSSPWGDDVRAHEGMFQRVYGATREALRAAYYEQTGTMLGDDIALSEWETFVYWLFKQRLKRQTKRGWQATRARGWGNSRGWSWRSASGAGACG